MLGSKEHQISSPARRHFLAVSAKATAKAMAVGAVFLASSRAKASNGGGLLDFGRGYDHGHGHGAGVHCFVAGTHIRTPLGETRIEDLQIGDAVMTMSGGAAPIRWIGRNTYRKIGDRWRKDVMPIRVARSAVEDDIPHRDLYLSGGHGLFIDGFLMPAMDLTNNVSIAPATILDRETLEYFQIELELHAVIWAEGLPVETFGGRNYEAFDNFEEFNALYPDGGSLKAPVAPNLGTWQSHLRALLRTGISRFTRVPDPLHSAYQRIAARARASHFDLAA